ncbi:FKBP-type peptidyl-prolyl cis-trans isomerase [Litoribacter populi]|uniref:FKBP-type peptidyl-prolyl cis-trans isomerase n=1 Tax=Litoribacter populi TaxID=2598460 RepID=UPI002939174B|nr:FKBP-type peptidyl-prolyl cis-trans isomerase [Litoribacter populi]
MMLKRSIIWAVLAITAFSCDQFDFGEQYDYDGNLARDKEKIENFLATNPYEYIEKIEDESGVVILVQEEGTANRPTAGSIVYTNYVGKLTDGTVFDTTYEDVAIENDIHNESRIYEPMSFSLFSQGTIEGFSHGFRNLRSGSTGVLIIPSPLAYRNDEERDNIPANSVLVFEVEFLGMD